MTRNKTTAAVPPVPPIPVAPPAPPVPATEPVQDTPSVPDTETKTEASNTVTVIHKKSKKKFLVSRDYYERNKSVLELA